MLLIVYTNTTGEQNVDRLFYTTNSRISAQARANTETEHVHQLNNDINDNVNEEVIVWVHYIRNSFSWFVCFRFPFCFSSLPLPFWEISGSALALSYKSIRSLLGCGVILTTIVNIGIAHVAVRVLPSPVFQIFLAIKWI